MTQFPPDSHLGSWSELPVGLFVSQKNAEGNDLAFKVLESLLQQCISVIEDFVNHTTEIRQKDMFTLVSLSYPEKSGCIRDFDMSMGR